MHTHVVPGRRTGGDAAERKKALSPVDVEPQTIGRRRRTPPRRDSSSRDGPYIRDSAVIVRGCVGACFAQSRAHTSSADHVLPSWHAAHDCSHRATVVVARAEGL